MCGICRLLSCQMAVNGPLPQSQALWTLVTPCRDYVILCGRPPRRSIEPVLHSAHILLAPPRGDDFYQTISIKFKTASKRTRVTKNKLVALVWSVVADYRTWRIISPPCLIASSFCGSIFQARSGKVFLRPSITFSILTTGRTLR